MAKVYLTPNAAYTIDRNGEQLRVKAINVPLADGCECDFDCCYGYISLPNYNSNSGDVDGFTAMYFVDGAPVYDTVDGARAAITAFKNNTIISATSVTISGCTGTNLSVGGGDTEQLTVLVNPTGALQTGVWSSSAPGFATVSVGGLVTAVAAGPAVITFTSTDGSFTDTCNVNIIA